MPALYGVEEKIGNAETGKRGNARIFRGSSRFPASALPRFRCCADQAGTSFPSTTGCAAPVDDVTLEGLPAALSFARMANGTASFAQLAVPPARRIGAHRVACASRTPTPQRG